MEESCLLLRDPRVSQGFGDLLFLNEGQRLYWDNGK